MYEIRVANSKVEKELAKIPMRERERIIDQIRRLAENPRPSGIKALASNVYRLRIGVCRVIYKVYDEEKIILIGRFARRSERTYRNWEKLF
ncbi:MAG: type II toxin-antitoxin system mRNA interferase toxin, RelE/StbE family [Chloroflexi bacterium CG07_land_8_20_14_0_80_45_17]|nr:MAG: type II toxin-antitoxin system mRNA interferase toxin, RelE/StbE family [Chloroflexi bacterium CG07_land_8_20_14_0_80_45_17]